SYTRSAVIGRAKRMGLVAPRRVRSPPIAPSPPNGPPPVQLRPRDRGQPSRSASMPAETVKLRCVGIRPRLISLLELDGGDCRYPYGGEKEGGEITCCGHPRRSGSSYCTPHFHLTRGSAAASERATGPVVLRLVAVA